MNQNNICQNCKHLFSIKAKLIHPIAGLPGDNMGYIDRCLLYHDLDLDNEILECNHFKKKEK